MPRPYIEFLLVRKQEQRVRVYDDELHDGWSHEDVAWDTVLNGESWWWDTIDSEAVFWETGEE
jgi:hypothetical protein